MAPLCHRAVRNASRQPVQIRFYTPADCGHRTPGASPAIKVTESDFSWYIRRPLQPFEFPIGAGGKQEDISVECPVVGCPRHQTGRSLEHSQDAAEFSRAAAARPSMVDLLTRKLHIPIQSLRNLCRTVINILHFPFNRFAGPDLRVSVKDCKQRNAFTLPVKHTGAFGRWDDHQGWGGRLLLRETDRRLNLLPRLAACFVDGHDPQLTKHSVQVAQRVFALALGYEDLNDHEQLRQDPVLRLLAGKVGVDEQALARKSTLKRVEWNDGTAGRYYRARLAEHKPARLTIFGLELGRLIQRMRISTPTLIALAHLRRFCSSTSLRAACLDQP